MWGSWHTTAGIPSLDTSRHFIRFRQQPFQPQAPTGELAGGDLEPFYSVPVCISLELESLRKRTGGRVTLILYIYIYLFIYVMLRSIGKWRKLHNEELRDLYSLPNIVRVVKSRRMRWAGHVARMGEGRGVHRFLVGKPEGKRPLGRPRRR